jgi:hypothetical protein
MVVCSNCELIIVASASIDSQYLIVMKISIAELDVVLNF